MSDELEKRESDELFGMNDEAKAYAEQRAKAYARNHPVDERWGLRPGHLMFAERYVLHGNGSRAAREAGYTERSGAQAWKLLKKDKIRLAIEDMRKEAAEKADVEVGYVIKNLVAEAENFDDGTPQSRIAANKLLGEYLRIFQADGAVNVEVPCKVFLGVNPDAV